MTLDHGIIRDLLPLYADGVCGPESKQAVEEHLAGCPACREEYEKLKDAITFGEAPVPGESQKAAALKRVRRVLSWKRVLAVCLAVVVTVAAVTGVGMWLNSATITVPAETVMGVTLIPALYTPEEAAQHMKEVQDSGVEMDVVDGDWDPITLYQDGEWRGMEDDLRQRLSELTSPDLEFSLDGKYSNYGMGYTARRIGEKYVLLTFIRVTRWEDFALGRQMRDSNTIRITTDWENWKGSVWAQYYGFQGWKEEENGALTLTTEEEEDLLPKPEDESCIFDEVYFIPDSRLHLDYLSKTGGDPDRMQALLEQHLAAGNAVLIWKREP